MTRIDDAINEQVGTFCRFYYGLIGTFALTDLSHAAQIFLIMFVAVPHEKIANNPHAKNATNITVDFNISDENKSYITGMLQSMFFVGFMIGTILFGQLADRFGRKYVGWKVFTVLVVVTGAAGFTQNWQELMVCRVIGGLCVGGLSVINTILLQEHCGSDMWAFNGNIGGLTFTITMLEFLLLAYIFPHWRTLCFASILPVSFGYAFYIYAPESARWFYSQERYSDAEKVLRIISKRNKKSSMEYKDLVNDDESDTVSTTSEVPSKKYSILDLFREPILRYRAIIAAFIWFTTSFVYYCITLAAGQFSKNFYTAFALSAIGQLPSIPITLFLMQRKWCGRSRTLFFLMILTSISMMALYIIPEVHNMATVRLCLSLVGKVGISGCFNLIYIYTPELFPTVVRNVGLGTMSTSARIGSIIAPFISNMTLHDGSATPFLVYGCFCGVSGILALRLPETRGKKIINTVAEAYEQEKPIVPEESMEISSTPTSPS